MCLSLGDDEYGAGLGTCLRGPFVGWGWNIDCNRRLWSGSIKEACRTRTLNGWQLWDATRGLQVLIQPMSRFGSLTLPATRNSCNLVSLQTRRPTGDLLT